MAAVYLTSSSLHNACYADLAYHTSSTQFSLGISLTEKSLDLLHIHDYLLVQFYPKTEKISFKIMVGLCEGDILALYANLCCFMLVTNRWNVN